MPVKIVSGVLVTRGHKTGSAIIDFSSNAIVGGDLDPRDLQKEVTIAEEGEMRTWYFEHTPCHTVGLREGTQHGQIHDHTKGPDTLILIDDHFEINSSANSTRLTIEWKGVGTFQVEEITYLAIGIPKRPAPGPS